MNETPVILGLKSKGRFGKESECTCVGILGKDNIESVGEMTNVLANEVEMECPQKMSQGRRYSH